MQNFQVIKSLGKLTGAFQFELVANHMTAFNEVPGEGAFSTVFKVKRISDGQEYALKKVSS